MKVLFLIFCLAFSLFSKSLDEYHDIFLKIDVHSKEIDVEKLIQDIRKARAKYPLDDKLKMVDMELENRYANEHKRKIVK